MNIFDYPESRHVRKHGPQGYKDFRQYKPWLRDEFTFRCVYCLCQERWYVNGQDGFSVDHFLPKKKFPQSECDYENLFYACVKCNSLKNEHVLGCDPCKESFTMHLEAKGDGRVHCKTSTGEKLKDVLRLNRSKLCELRKMLMKVLPVLERSDRPEDMAMLRFWRGFPMDLPDLRKERPPQGNSRPGGVLDSYFCRRESGFLPELY